MGCDRAAEPQPTGATSLVERIDIALAGAADYLVARQEDSGRWTSDIYAVFRDDPSLTPHVASVLFFLPQGGVSARQAFEKAVAYLDSTVDEDGNIREAFDHPMFPMYFAAAASWTVVLQQPTDRHKLVQRAWLEYTLDRRLGSRHGWTIDDLPFGGWGYSVVTPVKPDEGAVPGFMSSNISATLYGIAAMRNAGLVPVSDPEHDRAYKEILTFVLRCQNWHDDPARRDETFDDGGFFFTTTDPAMNKAGDAGFDASGRERFHSYGSATADGLRAMLRAGLPPGHPRVKAAREWLERNFAGTHHPGNFNPDREVLRQAYSYYYAWSVAHAFMHLGHTEIDTPEGKVQWAAVLAEDLLKEQQADGSWVLRFTDMKGDDPLVSTPHAAAALAVCRAVLTRQRLTVASAERFQKHPTTQPADR